MQPKISVVINTLNEEKSIQKAIESVRWADEVIVCDMYSEDQTVKIAQKLGAKTIYYKRVNYVEPARNFAISKAANEWILVLDPDEEIPQTLADKLIQIASGMEEIDYVRIPRKNIIFGSWVKTALWWPDYNIRFFKKGSVKWTDEIHRPPNTYGVGLDLSKEEGLAIIHQNYQTISQFIFRMDRYTNVESDWLIKQNYKFKWTDLIEKPLNEFLSRYFANKGYMDGIHGFSTSLLQAFSFLVVYLKIWERGGFKEQTIDLLKLEQEKDKNGLAINYWIKQSKFSKNPFKKFLQKIKG